MRRLVATVRYHRRNDSARSGLTILELVVVTGIIAVLASLLLPAVQQVRAASRRLQCKNNLRNVNLAMIQVAERDQRFPACGTFGKLGMHHSWVLELLPFLDKSSVSDAWNRDSGFSDPANQAIATTHIAVLTCPDDLSVAGQGDLSFVVNGGVGFTARMSDGTHDCPIHPSSGRLDLNGDGVTCPPDPSLDGTPTDKQHFLRLGLFFNETYKWDVTVRHHRLGSVVDGLSQTITLAENARTGYDPGNPTASNWSTSNPYRTSFYIGDPCAGAPCVEGSVDYARANADQYRINSGVKLPEGGSTAPNSFHPGGVNVAFGDGRVVFLNESIDGGVYAALVSPQGLQLAETPLRQGIAPDLSE